MLAAGSVAAIPCTILWVLAQLNLIDVLVMKVLLPYLVLFMLELATVASFPSLLFYTRVREDETVHHEVKSDSMHLQLHINERVTPLKWSQVVNVK